MPRINGVVTDDEKRLIDDACRLKGVSQREAIVLWARSMVGQKQNTVVDLKNRIEGLKTETDLTQKQIWTLEREYTAIIGRLSDTFDILADNERLVRQGKKREVDFDFLKAEMQNQLHNFGIAFESDWFDRNYLKHKQENASDLLEPIQLPTSQERVE